MEANNEYFASSLVEWGSSAGRQLRFGGNDPSGTVNQLLATTVVNDAALLQKLKEMNAITLGDVTEIVEEEGVRKRAWLSHRTLQRAGLGGLEPVLRNIPVPNVPLPIRAETCIIPDGDLTDDILEFLGWTEGKACVRRWTPFRKAQKVCGTLLVLLTFRGGQGRISLLTRKYCWLRAEQY